MQKSHCKNNQGKSLLGILFLIFAFNLAWESLLLILLLFLKQILLFNVVFTKGHKVS